MQCKKKVWMRGMASVAALVLAVVVVFEPHVAAGLVPAGTGGMGSMSSP